MEERSIREIIREEWKKLSGLSWGERLVYIWDYYKPLMVAVLVIMFAISIGVSIYQNKQINHLLYVYMVNCNTMEADADAIAADFGEYLGGIGEKDEITVDTSVTLNDEDASQYSVASQMKFTALVSAGDVDIVLFDEKSFAKYRDVRALKNLSEVLTEEQLSGWSDLLVYGPDPEEESTEQSEAADGGAGAEAQTEGGGAGAEAQTADIEHEPAPGEVPIGFKVQDSALLEKYHVYFGEPVYAAVMGSSDRTELSVKFLEYLLQTVQ